VHGIQSWVALPDGLEEVDPAFAHHPAATLPHRDSDGVELTVVAGRAFGLESPVATLWPTLYVSARLPDGSMLALPPEHTERAVYVAQGGIAVDGATLNEGQLAVFEAGTTPALRAIGETRLMLLGGERFTTPRHIWWNFVASSQDRIDRAKERWERQEFPAVPGETEFIPLPQT
jgi:redox-sensitive bicupin YhaK (pirin superfamily)